MTFCGRIGAGLRHQESINSRMRLWRVRDSKEVNSFVLTSERDSEPFSRKEKLVGGKRRMVKFPSIAEENQPITDAT
jgi:hypothetical protein